MKFEVVASGKFGVPLRGSQDTHGVVLRAHGGELVLIAASSYDVREFKVGKQVQLEHRLHGLTLTSGPWAGAQPMTTREDKLRAQLERETQRASVAKARLDVLLARQRTREKSQEATRHYRLGLVLEGFLFDDAVLLARVRERIERESSRVRAAFALKETASWFERPERVDSKTLVDTRRFRLEWCSSGCCQGMRR